MLISELGLPVVCRKCFSLAFYRQTSPFFFRESTFEFILHWNKFQTVMLFSCWWIKYWFQLCTSIGPWTRVICRVFLSLSFPFFSIRRPTYCRNMLCSRHWGMQIGKRAKKTRKKEVRVLTPSTAHSFQPRPAGLDLSGTLSLASVCETHIKCVSVPLNSS